MVCKSADGGSAEIAYIVELIINGGALVNQPHRRGALGLTPLTCVVRRGTNKGSEKMVAYLIDSRADVNLLDSYGSSLFPYAIERNLLKIATLLMDGGADVDSRDNLGNTGLYYAVQRRNPEILALLLGYGAIIHKREIKHGLRKFYKEHLTRKHMDERECSPNQFEEDLKQHGLYKFDTIEGLFRELPVDLIKLLSEFVMRENSEEDCILIAAQQYLKKINSQIT